MNIERRTIPNAADMAIEVVADIFVGTKPADLCGYIVIGLRKDEGFQIASNAKDEDAEIRILELILSSLKAVQPGGGS